MRAIVWYMRPEWFERGIYRESLPDKDDLSMTHIPVAVLDGDNEEIYAYMQGDNWSPNGEARELLRALGLRHTSMSMGDVVQRGDDAWIVAACGFDKL